MAEIQFKEITKRYPDGFEAVKSMDLEIGDGEFMILVGPSGCGKSTALRMIAGLEDITEGDLVIGGERVNDLAPRDRDIAMVFQNYALYPHMTVRENMGFALKLAKTSKDEIDRKVTEAARILDLEQHLERKPANLSGGQRQRVAMGRAIVRDPKAFLMDEPLSNLDAKLRVQMRTGVIQQVDTPANLYEDPHNLFVAGFIGSPSMNFLPGRLEGDIIKSPFGDAPLPEKLKSRLQREPGQGARDVIIGCRPEHFEDAHVEGELPDRLRFRTKVDVVESMGSELYVYFDVESGQATTAHAELAELAADAGMEDLPRHGDGAQQVVSRLSADSNAAPGGEVELSLDTSQIKLFDSGTGRSMTAPPT